MVTDQPSDAGARAHLREIGSKSVTAFAMKAVGFGASFLLNVVVARILGASESGLFFLALTVVAVAVPIARLGFDKPLVRLLAGFEARDDRDSVSVAVLLCLGLVAVVSGVIGLGVWIARDWLANVVFGKPEFEQYLGVMGWAIPALAIAGTIAFAYQGLKRIGLHLMFFTVLTPVLALVLIAVSQARGGELTLGSIYAICAAATAALALGAWTATSGWLGARPRRALIAPVLASCGSMLVITVAQLAMVWAPTLLLGAFGASDDLGRFHVAGRSALLISFVLIAVNSIAAPKFAALYANGEMETLRVTALRTTRIMALAALPIATVFVAWPGFIMGLFGHEFVAGAQLLRILAVGQFISTACGSVANLLMMTGHERDFRNICLSVSAVGVVAGAFVVARYGAIGAALLTAGMLITVNLLAARASKRRLGFAGLWSREQP